MTTFEKFQRFTAELQKKMPGFNVAYKDESLLMRLIGFLMFFNSSFMTKFVTTISKTVYFPNRQELESRKDPGFIATLAHEFVHACDSDRLSFGLFSFLYLFPQILSPFMLLFMFWHWWLGLLLFIVFLSPLPAPWRMHYEARGYTMSLFMQNELMKQNGVSLERRREYLLQSIEGFDIQFTSVNYYFMWPFGVKKRLTENLEKILDMTIYQEDDVYVVALSAVRNSV